MRCGQNWNVRNAAVAPAVQVCMRVEKGYHAASIPSMNAIGGKGTGGAESATPRPYVPCPQIDKHHM